MPCFVWYEGDIHISKVTLATLTNRPQISVAWLNKNISLSSKSKMGASDWQVSLLEDLPQGPGLLQYGCSAYSHLASGWPEEWGSHGNCAGDCLGLELRHMVTSKCKGGWESSFSCVPMKKRKERERRVRWTTPGLIKTFPVMIATCSTTFFFFFKISSLNYNGNSIIYQVSMLG